MNFISNQGSIDSTATTSEDRRQSIESCTILWIPTRSMQDKPSECYLSVKMKTNNARRGDDNHCALVSSCDGGSWDICILVYTRTISMEVTSSTLYNESIFKRYSIFNNTIKSGNYSLPQRPQPVALIHKEVHHTSEVCKQQSAQVGQSLVAIIYKTMLFSSQPFIF